MLLGHLDRDKNSSKSVPGHLCIGENISESTRGHLSRGDDRGYVGWVRLESRNNRKLA